MESFYSSAVLFKHAMLKFLRREVVEGGVKRWRIHLVEELLK